MIAWLELIAGGVLLYVGAEWFVKAASNLALYLRVPQVMIGLTVVAYGTSAPELIVGVEAARMGHGGVALGNVVGSNLANLGLILGGVALIQPIRVPAVLRSRELPMLLGSTSLLPILLWDGALGFAEGAVLLGVTLGYTVVTASVARTHALGTRAENGGEPTAGAGSARPMPGLKAALGAVAGLVVLLSGGHVFVNGAISMAQTLGVSDRVVGLTVVAVGTSLPELVTSLIAARRGHSDLAIGNVMGSNIFNNCLCLGAAAMAGKVGHTLRAVAYELVALLLMTALAGLMIRSERTISRLEGGVLFALYGVLMFVAVRGG